MNNISPNPLLSELVLKLRMIGKLEPDVRKKKAYSIAVESLLENAEKFSELVMTPSIKMAFKSLPGIGDSISAKIEEFIMTGNIKKLIELGGEDAKSIG
jgi:DNA polymerase/3'-5' exonuclease PolX